MKHHSKAAKSTTLSEPLQSFQQQKDFSRASSPQLYGKRAAVWLSLWDRGGTLTRLNLLEAFIFLHAESNASVLADDLGDAAELFLTRIASWLRLSYLRLLPEGGEGRRRRQPPPNAVRGIGRSAASSRLVKAHNPPSNETEKKKKEGGEGDQEGSGGHSDRDKLGMASYGGGTPPPPSSAVASSPSSPLLALVKALTIFSRGSGFLAQLAECGVVAALIDCLKRSGGKGDGAGLEASASPPPAFAPLAIEEKKAILLLLLYLANAGRVYRELICDEEGVADLLVVLQREADAAVAALLTELFITLGNGVPRLGLHVQCGLLRLILAERAVEEGLAAIPPAESRPPPPPSPSILLRPPPLPPPPPPPLSSPPASPRRASPARGISSSREARAAFALPSESFRESTLQAARALRGLQLSYEARYFGGFAEPGEDARGGGGRWEEVPVIGLGGCHAMDRAEGGASASGEPQGLLRPVSLTELLEALFFLASHECSSRYRVEGSELLTLVAKNIHLTAPILNHCFDVLNDDRLSITDDEEDLSLIRQQRHQLCCGRTAVQVILSKPMTARRHALIMKLIAIRSAHLSLLKYLRMTDQSDTAAVLGCCLALQIVARASNAAQHAHMLAPAWLSERPDGENDGDDAIRKPNDAVEFDDEFAFSPGPAGGGASHGNALLRVGHTIRDALGDSLYQVVLYQQLSEEECFAMQRASRDAVFTVK